MKKLLISLLLLVPILLRARDGDVRVYSGTSTYTSDVVCTVREGRVYAGTSSYTSDIICTFSGSLTVEEFVAVFLLLQLREM